ncbi:MAG: hypothetical protein JWR52_1768 [Marmoricola sp.]|nr:hypothetical protein [Marmoricola sp.]
MISMPGTGRGRATGLMSPRRLALVPESLEPTHDHLWALRDTEFNDSGLVLCRFECDCGAVKYT